MIGRRVSFLLVFLAFAGLAVAQEEGGDPDADPAPDSEEERFFDEDPVEEPVETRPEEVSLVGILAKVAATLVAIVVAIVGLGWLARRFVPGAGSSSPTGPIRVLTRVPLAPRSVVHLLQVGRRILVVGQTGESLRTLSEIEDPDEVAGLLTEFAEESARAGFRRLLRTAVDEYEESEADTSEHDEDVRRVTEELKRMREG